MIVVVSAADQTKLILIRIQRESFACLLAWYVLIDPDHLSELKN